MKDKPQPRLDFAADPDTAKKLGIVHSYLAIQSPTATAPEDPITRGVFRDRIAQERFAGRGVGDDLAFYAEIEKESTGRKDARLLMQDATSSAATAAILSAAGEDGTTYDQWITAARQRPGYRPDLEDVYFTEWRDRQRDLTERMAPVRDLIARQWAAMKEGKPADLEGLTGLMADEDQRETLLFAIGGLVKAMPKDQQPGVLANLRKQFLRRDLPLQAEGVMRSMRPIDRDEPLPDDYLDQLEPGTNLEAFEKRQRAAFERDTQLRERFVRKLESIVFDQYDPVVTFAKEGSNWAALEKGLYAAPGVGLTIGTAMLPGAGNFISYEVLRKTSTDMARDSLIQGGFTEDQAEEAAQGLGSAAALIQLPMERLGLAALTNRIPGVSKAINKVTTNLATRYLARAGASAATEFTTEMAQDLVPSILQDLAAAAGQDMPEVRWTGEGGVFQDYDKQSLEVLGAILPLSLVMAGGGVFTDRQIQATAALDDVTLRAAGMSPEAVAAVRAANGIGEQELALRAAWESRDITSESAVAAQQELTARTQADQQTAAEVARTGVMPTFYRSADGWSVRDGESGAEIGTSTTPDGALRLAIAHSAAIEEDNADQIAALATLLEAGEVVASTDQEGTRQTATDLRPGQVVTTSQQAAMSEMDDVRIRQQIEARERLGGSDGGTARMVLGQSVTETRQKVRNTVNRINAGGSVLTVFHEETHGFFREALATGRLTRDETLAAIRSLETVLAGKVTKDGQQLRFLPDGEVTDLQLDEAVSELMEAEILRTRKSNQGSTRANQGSTMPNQGTSRQLPPGLVTRNLTAMARLAPGAAAKLRDFIAAVRAFWGLTFQRAAAIKSAIREGTLDETQLEAFKTKLFGLEDQIDLEQAARDTEARILDGLESSSDPLQLDGDPFSLGPINPNSPGGANIGSGPQPDPEITAATGKKLGAGWVYHNTKTSDLPQIAREGLEGGSFTRKPGFDFGGDTWIAVRFSDLRNPEEQSYGKAVSIEPQWGPGMGEDTFHVIPSTRVAVVDKSGKVIKALSDFNQSSPAASGEFSLGPAALGRTTVTPTAETRLFEGAEGSPTVLGPAAFSIRAHHGTPHKVDKFTTAKIGTGEGAQAYGWGLYFAEDQSVAATYERVLSQQSYSGSIDGKPAAKSDAGIFYEIEHIHGGDVDAFIAANQAHWEKRIQAATDAGNIPRADSLREIMEEYNAIAEKARGRKLSTKRGGNLYTVTLKVEDDQLLDWDKSLSGQSDMVAQALESLGLVDRSSGFVIGDGSMFYRDAGDPATAAQTLLAAGIRGIRYLDGNSRGDGQGSYNYVIFDEADIEILEENGQPVAPSMSLGPAALADLLGKDAVSRIKDPVRRAQAMSRIAREMEAARLQFERLELIAGSKRLKKSLAREASIREALRREELENEAMARHWQVLSDDDLVKIKSQPAHSLLTDPTNPLRGRIQSRTATIRQNPDLYAFKDPAEYDGSETVSRAVFGGTLTPDQAVEQLVEAGLLREGSKPDDLWNLLNAEALSVSNRKRDLETAKQELREARTQAKDETNVWLREQGVVQETNFSDKQEILRALGVLDGILSSVPAEIRGKIGGYTQLARIATNEAKLSFLKDRLAKVDRELEKYLRDQFDREFRALLDKAKPDKDEAGKKPRGKIGADVHELFAAVRNAMTMTGAEVEAEALALESLAASGDYTAAQESHLTLEANMIRLAGDWGKADAARREAALIEATSIFNAGYMAHKIQTLQKREKRQKVRDALQTATGKAGTREERRGKQQKDEASKAGRALTTLFSLMSFEQVVERAFGPDTQEARDLVDWERHAAHAKADAVQNKLDQLDDLFTTLAGGKLKGEELRFAMSRPDAITVDGQTFSELEAITATLMWRQEDGQRHMTGHVDDQGAPAGDWNYTQSFIDQLEAKLSQNAKAVRLHLAEQYAAEYDRLNAVFRDLNGVSLPRHKHYSPLTVKPVQSAGGQMLDPVTGMAMSGAGFTPGSLKNRSQSAIAEPDFKDALQVYIGHAKQMEHWIAYAPFATEAMAILNTRDLGNSVEAAAGKEALSVLRSWLDVFAQGGTRDAAAHLGLNKLLGRITGRAAATALVGRVSVLAIQSTQLGAALAEMPTASYLSRLGRLFAGRLDWSGALASDYIQRRKAQMPPIVQQAMEGLTSSKPSRLKYAVRKMGETISGADALFTAGTFAIVLDYQMKQAKALGLTGAAAKAYALEAAERSTDRVAQPVRPGTRSLYEVTAVNPLARISWSFASDARQKLALSAYALANKPPAAKARALAVTWIAGGVVASIIRAAMRDIRDDGEDDEIFDQKNWDPKRLALQSFTGPLAGVPAIGDAMEGLVFQLFGEYLPEGNLISGFQTSGRAAGNVPDWFTGDRTGWEEAIKDAEALMSGFGLLSDSAAAVTSLLHVARDLFGIGQNLTD
jgi:hypothetical protein